MAFLAGRFPAVLGTQIVSTTAGWQLYERTNDAWALAAVGIVELAPVLLLILPAGNLADRVARRSIAMSAHALMACAAVGLALVSAFEGPTFAMYACLAAIGAARAFAAPSVGTMLPQLLPPEEFAAATAYSSSTFQIAVVSGPALAGYVIDQEGPTLAYALAAGGHLVFIAMLLFVPAVRPARGTTRSTRDMLAGFRFILRNRVFLGAITLDMFAVLLGGAVALLPIFVKDVLHLGATELGWLRAAPGIGAALTALVLSWLAPWRRPGRALLVTVCGFGVATIGFGLSESLVLSFVCLLFTGVFDEVSVLIRLTLEQLITPDRLRGRVSSVNHIFIGFSNQFGAFESGTMAALLGPVPAVVLGGLGSIVVATAVWRLFPEVVALGPLAGLRPAEEPPDALPAHGAAGIRTVGEATGVSMKCSSCQAEVPQSERFCGACGYDTHKDDHIANVLEPKLRQARGWILAVGIIYLVSAILYTTLLSDRMGGDPTFTLALNGVLCAVHIGLWFWAKTAPLAAAVVALVLFGTLQVVEAALDPSSLGRGVIIKVLFLFALISAVRAGIEAQRIRRERA